MSCVVVLCVCDVCAFFLSEPSNPLSSSFPQQGLSRDWLDMTDSETSHYATTSDNNSKRFLEGSPPVPCRPRSSDDYLHPVAEQSDIGLKFSNVPSK